MKHFFALLILAWPLAACLSGPKVEPTMPPTVVTATATPSPTLTFTPPPTFTLAASATAPFEFVVQPLTIATALPPAANPPGQLVLSGLYLLDFAEATKRQVAEAQLCVSTSPDGQWLTYCRLEPSAADNGLILANAEGVEQRRIPLKQNWQWLFKIFWLDNEHIALNTWEGAGLIAPVLSMVVINPFTGEQQDFPSNYPDLKAFMSGSLGQRHFVDSTVVYSTDRNLVIYPARKSSFYIVLWNRQTQTALAELADRNEFGHAPVWAPDGQAFIVAVLHWVRPGSGERVEELFSVSRTGVVQQLTFFNQVLGSAQVGGRGAWSPDARYFAFWLKTQPNSCPLAADNLAVLEVRTQRVINYCVPGNQVEHTHSLAPIWSPDSRYIAVAHYVGENERQAILVDIEQGWAAYLGENEAPLGWLASTP